MTERLVTLGIERIARQTRTALGHLPRRMPMEGWRTFDWGSVNHGDWSRWLAAVGRLPERPLDATNHLDRAAITACADGELSGLEDVLRELIPWRKGPYELFGVNIDTEWRSDLKWDRLVDQIQPLEGRRVLDIGSGNGYHLWRMLGAGADFALGVDPTWVFVAQFHAVAHLLGETRAGIVPTTLEQFPQRPRFDTVFSMGVLYHRRDPFTHLGELKACLRPGGELVLETLVVEGDATTILTPADRYAGMRNVWFLPSPDAVIGWLRRMGFTAPELVDVSVTTAEEQHRTDWFGDRQSLADFLDPEDLSRTREGLPAPRRAIITARRPG
ncbi:tRNA 5-methoxyuridine(34)/uridine 5-oxyacetic acid(34) synthase CmoB [Guyparkeria hydrothermalis]|uniref:tRNA 5-methoxyuridine(34)/uridine 5-oxyacetic acid(34) synthase CmoB n=1 Tax=Guyparkeria hydrothermalis TaxID=923 RepID=UPI002021A462|nr:tRNA 5-methoxyuridine(34)/uridine 5-oxyacetic acid(34) synthase CmoB [Guyparkeria hydrothermalis]MCL7744952.1 tRNA 5-methoxyuridine(34)/uridine 5-oxyacetic acid(34) synthase CmoB [Guyparkeria hydrothermalis]